MGHVALASLLVAFVITMLAGWITNIVSIVALAQADQFTVMFVLRCVGLVLAPVGSILGVIDWF
jgi:hypothetical protein